MKPSSLLALAAALCAFTLHAQAQEIKKGSLTLIKPYAMASAPGQPNGAMYIQEIRNASSQADELIGARSAQAKSMEVHRMSMENNVMTMREITGIPIAASGKIAMDRGNKEGYHLMLMGLASPLKEGETFQVTLLFRHAGEIQVNVAIEKPKASGHHHQH